MDEPFVPSLLVLQVPALQDLQSQDFVEGVRVQFDYEPHTNEKIAEAIVASDLALAALPLPLAFLYLLLYTGSVFLAGAATLQLAVGWPCALFLYRHVFQYGHIEELTLLASPLTAPFILEAVSLLIDVWRASTAQPAAVLHDLPSRLNWVMREAGIASLHSIFVGIAGFVACALSPWLAIAHFGAFCALILITQLLLVLLYFPACLVIYHDWLENKPNLCCLCCVPRFLRKAANISGGRTREPVTTWDAIASLWKAQAKTSTEHYRDARFLETQVGLHPEPPVRRDIRAWPIPKLLTRTIGPLLHHRKSRHVILWLLGGLFAPIGISISSASVAQRQRGRLFDTHPLLATRSAIEEHFGVSSIEKTVRTTLMWGVEQMKTKGGDWEVNLLRNSSFYGRVVWRENMDFDEAAQLYLMDACDEVRRPHRPVS